MPPANDNFASATVISSYQGNTGVLDNVGATAETGEPGNYGKTVWFKWTYDAGPGEVAGIQFSTLNDQGGTPTPDPFLRTSVRVFYSLSGAGSETVNNLVEVTYILDWREKYANWNKGSIVAFDPVDLGGGTVAQTYFIQVDGVGGEEGNFVLKWGRYTGLVFGGGCDGCPPHYATGQSCPTTTQVTDVSQAGTFLFGSPGTYDAGVYTVRYCSGYWSAHGNSYYNISSATGGTVVEHDDGASTTSFTPNPIDDYRTVNLALIAARCISATFVHTGGTIGIQFTDNPYTDNVQGVRPMTFGLYRRFAVFSATAQAASWVGGGPTASVTFRVRNITEVDWSGLSVTLAATGGISSPSTASSVTILANAYTDVTLTFTPTTAGDTQFVATLQFSDAYGNTLDDVAVLLAPVLSWSYILGSQTLCGGGGQNMQQMSIQVTNSGNFPSKALVADITITGDTAYYPSTCSGAVASFNMSWPNINPGASQLGSVTGPGGTGSYIRPFVTPAVNAGFAFSSIADGPVAYADKSVSVALPGTPAVYVSF